MNLPEAKGTMPDVVTESSIILIKATSSLCASYQIRLLAYLALKENKTLVIEIPEHCKLHSSLSKLMDIIPSTILIKRIKV